MGQGTSTPGIARRRLVRGTSPPPHSTYYGTDSCPGCFVLLNALAFGCKGAAKARKWRDASPVPRDEFRAHRDALVRHGMVAKKPDRAYHPTDHYNHMAYWGVKWLIEDLVQIHPEAAYYGGAGVNMFGGQVPLTNAWVKGLRSTIRQSVREEIRRVQRRAGGRKTERTPKEAAAQGRNRFRNYPRIIVIDVRQLFATASGGVDRPTHTIDPLAEWIETHVKLADDTQVADDLRAARRIASRRPEAGGGRPRRVKPRAATDPSARSGTE
jgi:hypothetical protein